MQSLSNSLASSSSVRPSPDKPRSGAGTTLRTPANTMLTAMQDSALALTTAGRRVHLAAGEVLWRAGQLATDVCFPLDGLVVSLTEDVDGVAAEVDCTGAEGAIGLAEVMAASVHVFEARAVTATEAWLVPADAMRRLAAECPSTAGLIHRRQLATYNQSRRAIVCCSRHMLRARLADRLLAYDEKTGLTRLTVTQEALSAALGANRTTVTAVMKELSQKALTRTGRGWVSILDREGLDRLACGCRKPMRP